MIFVALGKTYAVILFGILFVVLSLLGCSSAHGSISSVSELNAKDHPENDCLLGAIMAQHEMPKAVWGEVVIAHHFPHWNQNHAFYIFYYARQCWSYDRLRGTRKIYPRSLDLKDLLKTVALNSWGGEIVSKNSSSTRRKK